MVGSLPVVMRGSLMVTGRLMMLSRSRFSALAADLFVKRAIVCCSGRFSSGPAGFRMLFFVSTPGIHIKTFLCGE